MADFLKGKTVEEMTPFSSYQRHGRYYELSLCFLVLLQTLWNVFGPCVSLFVAIIGRHSLALMSRGAYLPVTTVTIVLAGVIQETQKEGGLKALRQDGIEKLIDTLTASAA